MSGTAPSLYALEIAGAGKSTVEALTSHIPRRAKLHGRTTTWLVQLIETESGWAWRGHGQAGALNGYGTCQARMSGGLARLTGLGDISQMSLAQIGPAFADNGMGTLKPMRHWCPVCFFEWRKCATPAYDMLIWQLVELALCPLHRSPLLAACPMCKRPQRHLSPDGALDLCQSCGHWLGAETSEGSLEPSARSYQEWLISSYCELLESRVAITPRLTTFECSTFLKAVLRSREVPVDALARRICVPQDTIRQWISARIRPTLRSWVQLCANLGVTPAQTLLDPLQAAAQLPLPFQGANVYVKTRPAPRRRHSKEKLLKQVSLELQKKVPTVSGPVALAHRLGVPASMLYFHAPKETKALAAKTRTLAVKKDAILRKSLRRSADRAVARLQRKKVPITRRAFVNEIQSRSNCGLRQAKQLFHRIMPAVRNEAH